MGIEHEVYYGSETDPNVEACLVVNGSEPIDHTVYYVIITRENGTAGKHILYCIFQTKKI